MQIARDSAAGKDTSKSVAKLADEQKKLAKNIQLDVAAAGAPAKGVTGGAAAAPAAPAAPETPAAPEAPAAPAAGTGNSAAGFQFPVQE